MELFKITYVYIHVYTHIYYVYVYIPKYIYIYTMYIYLSNFKQFHYFPHDIPIALYTE
jgi:hypothetical protein